MPRRKSLQKLPPIPDKKYFPIREAAILCGVATHVLRYWEKQFTQLRPPRRGAHRYYRHEDIELVRHIRDLLYGHNLSVVGVQQRLIDEFKDGRPKTFPSLDEIVKQPRIKVVSPKLGSFDLAELDLIIRNLEKTRETLLKQ